MNELPNWMHYISALGAPLVALMVAFIAYRQWRTNHERVVLDLFEKRLEMVEGVRLRARRIVFHSRDRFADEKPIGETMRGAKFLFGQDVQSRFERVARRIIDWYLIEVEIADAEGTDRQNLLNERRAIKDELKAFLDDLDDLVAPYLKMHQKSSWRWTIRLRNGVRAWRNGVGQWWQSKRKKAG